MITRLDARQYCIAAAVLLAPVLLAPAALARTSVARSYVSTCAVVAHLAGIAPMAARCNDNSLSGTGFSSLRGPKAPGWEVTIDYGIFRNTGDAEGNVRLGSQNTALHRRSLGVPGLAGSEVYSRASAKASALAASLDAGETEALFAIGRVYVDLSLKPDRLRTGVLKPDFQLLYKLARRVAEPIPRS